MAMKQFQVGGEMLHHTDGAQHMRVEGGTINVGTVSTTVTTGTVNIAGTVPMYYDPQTTISCGEFIVGTSGTILPTVTCKMAFLRSADTNASYIYVGGSGVTAADGTTDTTTGFQLVANEQFGPLPISNLNKLYAIAGTTAQRLTYLAIN